MSDLLYVILGVFGFCVSSYMLFGTTLNGRGTGYITMQVTQGLVGGMMLSLSLLIHGILRLCGLPGIPGMP